jgi:DNA-binding NtrC family response regulator
LRSLDAYAWPGNVRELENLVHSEFLMTEAEEIRLSLPGSRAARSQQASPHPASPPQAAFADSPLPNYRRAKAEALERFDRAYLQRLLAEAEGNVTSAARIAGKERRALGKLLKHYRIGHGYEAGADRDVR